ncbi:hypothetical protein HDU97_004396 [Phlyctochytrium planicorne]|nr:hypothetical protein HDU97_004396 [Phlyctochytrium planicorne]
MPDSTAKVLQKDLFDIIPNTVLIGDISASVAKEQSFMANHSFALAQAIGADPKTEISATDIFKDYQAPETIFTFVSSLPGINRTVVGQTYLKEDIPVFKLGKGSKNIVILGGIHAREWISPAVVTYITHFLATDAGAADLLNFFTFHLVPVFNIDGYKFTRKPDGDRYWRKNLQANAKSTCVGTDLNRNWGTGFGAAGGASTSECEEDYQGPSAFSAPETKAMSDYILRIGAAGFIDFHSYGQLWMFPNGYTCDNPIKDYALLQMGGEKAVAALKSVNGFVFTNGDVCNTIYQASGASLDWAYHGANVTFSFTVELRDRGTLGFRLPADQIVPAGKEAVEAVTTLWQYMNAYYNGTLTVAPVATAQPRKPSSASQSSSALALTLALMHIVALWLLPF